MLAKLSIAVAGALVLTALAAPRGYYFDPVTAPDGSGRCCSKGYRPCLESCGGGRLCGGGPCAPEAACVTKCLDTQCTPNTAPCAEPAAEMPAGPAGTGAAKREMRGDGRLVGPGLVTFEVFNRGTSPLTTIGIIFGKDKTTGATEVLKKSGEHGVIPAEPAKFTLTVSDGEYSSWAKRFTELTIAFSFPTEAEKSRWRYENLLTPHDQETTPAGEFRIRGAFHPLR